MLTATGHDEFLAADYWRLQAAGIFTVRSGLRWHLIEKTPQQYDFSSAMAEIRLAQEMGMQVIWDLFHYGWPDDIDIFTPAFVKRFARFSAAFAHILQNETDSVPFLSPINEISFMAWGGGDAGYLNPFQHGRGFELKSQLVRAAIEATEAIWHVLPNARIVHTDPLINVVAAPDRPEDIGEAYGHQQSQYQAWDMLSGRMWPMLGGAEKYLDIIGVNYYSNNQWIHGGPTLDRFHPLYRPFRQMLREVYERYERPMFVAETGIEDEARPGWLAYVSEEVQAAMAASVPIEGICLYPILNHPGWDNDRHCHNGLWDYADEAGNRALYEPLHAELQQQMKQFDITRTTRDVRDNSHRLSLITGQRKAKVCLFTDSLEPSGMGEHMLALAAELHQQFDIILICPLTPNSETLIKRAKELPITVMTLEVRGQNRAAWEKLRDWLRAENIDIFHSHAGIGWEGHDGVYAAYYAGVSVILRTEHLPYLITDGGQKASHTRLLTKIERLISVSDGAYRSFVQAGIPKTKLTMIHNGIVPRFSSLSKAQAQSRLNLPRKVKIVLTVGRMMPQKGYNYLLEAVPLVISQYPDVHFVWVGDGPLAEPLGDEITKRGLSSHIHWLGHRDDVPDLLAAADVFVLPSLFEGLPLVLLEAMAMRLPIVATNVPGTDEVIEDGVTGRLVPPADPLALAAALIETQQLPQRIARWQAAANVRFNDRFAASRMAEEVAAVYQELLQNADLLPAKTTLPNMTEPSLVS
jgi:glycosyltransferase involved in cell wall biosynthesis